MKIIESMGRGFKITFLSLGGLKRPLIGGAIIALAIAIQLLIIKSFGFDVASLPFGTVRLNAGGITYLLIAGMMIFHIFSYVRKEKLQGIALVERGWVYGIFLWFLTAVMGVFSKDILTYGITSAPLMMSINISLIFMIVLGIIVAVLHEKIP